MTNTQNVTELQPRMTREQLVDAARTAAKFLPVASAQLMNELATRLDYTSAALCESMEQRKKLAGENGLMIRLLTDISENHGEFVNEDDDYLYASVPMDYVSEINAHVSRDVNAENPFSVTDAFFDEVRASAIPEGWKLVPEQMHIDASDIESICDRCGNGDELYGDFTDGILWVGELSNNGAMKYGLNVASADYPDEGSITIHEFKDIVGKGSN